MNKNRVIASRLPGGHTTYRCTSCGCGVRPEHVPDSVECDEFYALKMESVRD